MTFITGAPQVLPISIQVVAEAADLVARCTLAACQSARLLPKLVDTITSKEAARMRQCCAAYLLQVPPTPPAVHTSCLVSKAFRSLKYVWRQYENI